MSETAEKPEAPKLGNILLVDDTPANLGVVPFGFWPENNA